MITSVLVANRGEIARRVFRTCRDLGLSTVAVASDADEADGVPHAREADAAVRLPGAAPADTYLRGDLIVKAALAAGADAVHPGYGFLSENADFARAVADAGLVWIGPPPAAIEAMASKTRAKQLMAGAGVPVFAPLEDPGESDLPLLVKAAAGGGGRGMRVVRELALLEREIESARAEAASAFGDGEVFVEPYAERARHVEVQVLADTHGTVWALGTRDCSLQRRHQKVIEEAPAPGLGEALTGVLCEAAVAAARAVGYVGAGTVEFLVSAEGRPYFLEMNTRLQVEHPVTECVHGLDLVAWQLRIAEGTALDSDGPPPARGHAVEARLYAEDPARGWRPQTGTVLRLDVPDSVRTDSGVEAGTEVGVHYDPMLAKVVAHAPTREEAVRKLARALDGARVHGPETNRSLLVRSLRHAEFMAGRVDTGFYDRHLPLLTAAEEDDSLPLLAAALAEAARNAAPRVGGWRNVVSQPCTKRFRCEPEGAERTVRYRWERGGALTPVDLPGVRVVSASGALVVLEAEGVRRAFAVSAYGARVHVDSPLGAHAFTALPLLREPESTLAPGSLVAPMPGTVVRVAEGLAPGSPVTAGQPLLWLEAMKMEHEVVAPTEGLLSSLAVKVGQQVASGAVLAVVT
ncbi:biotin carboxylase N-terminal domain-containing protein [Streptomyces sp. NPDC048172]|uniref:ATP-binding protein n=1 Tax=Streptomyces sp. NPDC048172 TaxID=3365505 RepID=UPI003723CE6F